MSRDPASDMLLTMAEKDFTALRKMAEDTDFADEIFGFHAQQAVEKAAKAMIAAHGLTFDRTHDLETLFEMLSSNNIIPSDEFETLLDLTDFAVQFRYDAFEALDITIDRRTIVAEVRRFLDRGVLILGKT